MTTTESPATGTVPTSEELLRRVGELQPILAKNSAQGEHDRRVVEDSMQALTEAGVFKIAQPKRYGGYQTSMRTMLDVSAAVAEADGGTAWVVTLCNVCAWMTGLYSDQAQNDVWGTNPDAKVSGVLAPTAESVKVDGGFRVTGRWFYIPALGTRTGPCWAFPSPTRAVRWSTKAWHSSRGRTSTSRRPGSSPA